MEAGPLKEPPFVFDETQINVFDAEHIDDGPVATARFPYSLPLGFHGKWAADDPLV